MRRPAHIIPCAVATAIFLCGSSLLFGHPPFGPAVSLAEEGWKVEELVARCDYLKPRIEAEEESTRKVYLRRLQMCRELYGYILVSKEPR
jgi:hypothetical protein